MLRREEFTRSLIDFQPLIDLYKPDRPHQAVPSDSESHGRSLWQPRNSQVNIGSIGQGEGEKVGDI